MRPRQGPVPASLRAAGVTPRELEIFWLVADRLHNKEIAARLYVSERTVESHVSSLLHKLGEPDRQALIDVAARLRDRRGPGGSLPRPLSSFVGRGEEIDALRRLISDHRLVTLTGPAGAGKTRLAMHLAGSEDSRPPAVLVDLAIAAPGADVERLFADALGVAGEDPRSRARLRETLADEPHWLVVDNCEHVADTTASLVADLLSSTTQLSVLATSHGPLHIPGEVVYQVPPLPLPPDTDDPSEVVGTASGRLFADRAATASPGFTITADNARDVAEVCRRLDGLPLAIELAAARVRVFSPAELLAHIDDRFAMLTDGAQGTGSRHLTLEGALRWSYELLDDEEQLLLERCSVFPGDFDYDTAADVLAYPPLARADLARRFPRLLDRSLLSAIRRGRHTEYRMLDSIRVFARERLAERGELDLVREHHAHHHLRYGAALLPDLQGRDQTAALAWFDRRWADLRTAMQWALDHRETRAAWGFLAGIGTGWEILGLRGEVFDWLDVLLERPLPAGRLGIRAGVTAVMLLWYQDQGRAQALAQLVHERAKGGDARDQGLAHLSLGWAMYDRASTNPHMEEAAEEFRLLGDDWHQALALEVLGSVGSDAESSLATLARAADLFGRIHDQVKRANVLNIMAARAIDVGAHLDDAEAWLAESRRLAELTSNHHELLHAEVSQARLDQRRGDQASVGPRFERLLPEFRRIGDGRCACRCLLGLGRAAAAAGDHDASRHHLTGCIEIAETTGQRLAMAEALLLLAELDHAAGLSRRAAVLLGAADAAAEHLDAARRQALPPDHTLRMALQHELQPAGFASALAEGRRTPPSELLAT